MAVPFTYDVAPRNVRTGVVCHIFHDELAEEIISCLSHAHLQADLFISTDAEDKAQRIRAAANKWQNGSTTIRMVENRGRDIAPKLVTFADVYDRYQLILCLHSKRSDHYEFGGSWREYLFKCLAGSPAIVQSIQEIFGLRPDVGMIAPPHHHGLGMECLHWGSNFRKSRRIGWKMNVDIEEGGIVDFPSGSMFWTRPEALKPLLRLKLALSDFDPEPCAVDGTLAHSIEHLFFFSCESAGFKWLKVINPDVASPEQLRVTIGEPSQIDQFIERHGFDLKSAQTDWHIARRKPT
jgi:lipopolysaccharide biosynthesis protein